MALTHEDLVHTGWMDKKGAFSLFGDSWKRRYFCLTLKKDIKYFEANSAGNDQVSDDRGRPIPPTGTDLSLVGLLLCILWVFDIELFVAGKELGSVELQTAYKCQPMPADQPDKRTEFGFTVATRERVWEFFADTDKERKKWMGAILDLVESNLDAYPSRAEGWLLKEGAINSAFQPRWILINHSNLLYFLSPDDCQKYKVCIDKFPGEANALPKGIVFISFPHFDRVDHVHAVIGCISYF
jgi:hypothetical protein